MRVLYIHNGLLWGGIETLLVTLAKRRAAYPDMQPEFALCFSGRLESELTAAGVKVHILGPVRVRWPRTVWNARRKLSKILFHNPFNVAVFNSAWPQAVFGSVVKRAKLPSVFWLHDVTNGRHWLERWAQMTKPRLAIANSRFNAASLLGFFPDTKIAVVRPMQAPPDHAIEKTDRQALRMKLGTPLEATVIIQASRMQAWKGHALHLRALANLKDRGDWVCWQVGGPQRPQEIPYFESLKRMALELGISERVHFLGQRSDVSDLLGCADIFCQPNLTPEPFPLGFIQALYAGLPIVSTVFGGIEIVNESCGFSVPANDPSALAGVLRQLIEQPEVRRVMGLRGPSYAKQLSDPSEQMGQLRDLLRQAATTAD